MLREFDASELTQAEFARRAGVKYPTFASWLQARRLRGGCRHEQLGRSAVR
ncbi:MAG: hypothetical protein ACREH8_16450 [Opitutaceae bacterium]